MGVDTNTYLGHYFKVLSDKTSKEIDHCKNRKQCPDADGEGITRYNPDSHCTVCGIKNSNRFSETFPRPDFFDILGGERLSRCLNNTGDGPFSDEEEQFIDCLVPNSYNGNTNRDFHCNESQDIPSESRGLEITWLRKEYKKEFAKLKEVFGTESVTTEWGFLIWWA